MTLLGALREEYKLPRHEHASTELALRLDTRSEAYPHPSDLIVPEY